MNRFLQIIFLIISSNVIAAGVIIPYGKNSLTGQLCKYEDECTIPDNSANGSWITGTGQTINTKKMAD